ncbi:polymorphic toxin-type HINT domain-containing protein, partial [Streptomyces gilvus]|uniref:polymorphic toxin-type HINT domain-containing protein n=1 Tax=Streptomyces gilvus TaxID=2920937 RepID=UPI001F0EB065
RRAAARKAAARPKPRAKPRSQPKPRPKPSQVKRAVKKVAREVRDEARETAKDEAQNAVCEANSFVPGTRVLMADGSTKPIEKVRAGDKVLATDPRTGGTSVQTATATITGKGTKHLVRITLTVHDGRSAAKPTTVTATAGHPFWVPSLREWIDAGELKPGQWLQTSSGTWVQIGAVEAWTARSTTVHNLTVTDTHTYYVLAGATTLLAHNCGWSELAAYRAREGMPARGSEDDTFTAARLQVGGQVFFGRNAHGRAVDIRVNAQTKTHAEADVFQQAKDAGATGDLAVLHVDRDFCRSCGATGGVGSLMRGLGVQELLVHTPSGIFTVNAVRRPSTPRRLR